MYDQFFASRHWAILQAYEDLFLRSDGTAAREAIGSAAWGAATAPVLADLDEINSQLNDAIAHRADDLSAGVIRQGLIAGGIGLLAVLLSIFISVRLGQSLVRELLSLRNAAQELAGVRLPAVMRRLRRGEQVDVAAESAAAGRHGQARSARSAEAFNAVQRAAVEAAVEQAELRRGVSAVFVNLARRSQVLLHRQLTLLDAMERRTEDPAELDDLFRLDHLTTRMRRHAEGLIILSGAARRAGPGASPVRMVDVVRAAVGEVEDYARVDVRPFPGTAVAGPRRRRRHPPDRRTRRERHGASRRRTPRSPSPARSSPTASPLEIDDRGLGMSAEALAEANLRLAEEQEFDLADTDRLGLFVVSRLARRHELRVALRPSPYGGTSAGRC